MPPAPTATEQRKRFETRRKTDMVLDWIAMHAAMREQAGAFGKMSVDMVWEQGAVKRIVLTDTVTVEDLTDRERELVMRAAAGKDDARGEQNAPGQLDKNSGGA